jgi:hypothetical protein
MKQRSIISRRTLLKTGAVATGGLITLVPGWSFAEANTNPLLDQMRTLYTDPKTSALFQFLSGIVADPAYPAMARNILTNYRSSLTQFQASLLQSFLIMSNDAGAVSTILSGQHLTKNQIAALKSIREQLEKNPAHQMVLRSASKLKESYNKPLLQSYINADLPFNADLSGPQPSLGDTTLDTMVANVYTLAGSSALQGLLAPATSIAQNKDFITLLRKQHSEVLAGYIPSDVLLAFLLPNDKDPLLPSEVQFALDLIATLMQLIDTVQATAGFIGFSLAILAADLPIAILLTLLPELIYLLYLATKMVIHWTLAVNAISKLFPPSVIVDYGASGYLYEVVPTGTVQGFEVPTFDDSAFQTGRAAFGLALNGCPLDATINTSWASDMDILVRRDINLPTKTTGLNVHVAIDNDVIVYWNGVQIGSAVHEGCAARDTLIAPVPNSVAVVGENVLAIRGIDRGASTYLDLQVRVG